MGRPGGGGRPDPCPWDADGEVALQRGGQCREPDGWSQVTLEPSAQGPGIREWLEGLGAVDGKRAAAFDTRAPGPALLTGRASTGIAKQLREHGFTLVADPESFIIDTHQRLRDGEEERAATWASSLVPELVTAD